MPADRHKPWAAGRLLCHSEVLNMLELLECETIAKQHSSFVSYAVDTVFWYLMNQRRSFIGIAALFRVLQRISAYRIFIRYTIQAMVLEDAQCTCLLTSQRTEVQWSDLFTIGVCSCESVFFLLLRESNIFIVKFNAIRMLHIYYTGIMKTVEGVFSVVSAVVLQALLSVGQLTSSAAVYSPENYVVDITSPAMHISEMKQVSLCRAVMLLGYVG